MPDASFFVLYPDDAAVTLRLAHFDAQGLFEYVCLAG